MKISITLPTSIEFISRGQTFTFDPTVIPEEKLEEFVVEGFIRGVSKTAIDSGSGAKALSESEKDMTLVEATNIMIDQCLAKFAKGDWTQSRMGGQSLNALDRMMISIIRPQVKASLGADKYKDLEESERVVEVQKYIARLNEAQLNTLTKMAQKRVDEAERAKAEAAELAKAFDL